MTQLYSDLRMLSNKVDMNRLNFDSDAVSGAPVYARSMVDRAVPNLPSRDFDATVRFYERIGFVVEFRDEGWLILRRGTLRLEFFPFADIDPWTSDHMCSVRVSDLDELHTTIDRSGIPLGTTGIPRLTRIALEPWGQRVAYLIDLDGNQLSLIEDMRESQRDDAPP